MILKVMMKHEKHDVHYNNFMHDDVNKALLNSQGNAKYNNTQSTDNICSNEHSNNSI